MNQPRVELLVNLYPWKPSMALFRALEWRIIYRHKMLLSTPILDLGCGDGRIVIAAAREFGSYATGIEIDPFRVLWARTMVRIRGVHSRVRIRWGNMYRTDLSTADIVVLFLSATANAKLERKLQQELHPEARIVSHYHPMPDWTPTEIAKTQRGNPLYLYVVARVPHQQEAEHEKAKT